jgi:endonuclease/exonuclease/phosphatase (EEP) superfamily protein YafD
VTSRTAPTREAWDTRPPGRAGQGWLVTLGLLALVPALVATALRVVPPSDDFPALAASFLPYGLVFWVPALVLLGAAAVRARRGSTIARVGLLVLTLICLIGVLATAAWQGPAFVPDRQPATTEPLTVVSLNVAGSAEPSAAAEATARADVVTFVEASPGWVDALPLRFREEFPYAVGAPLRYDSGSVIFSRHPITSSEALPTSSFQQWSAIIETPQLGAVRVVAVHPCNPFCGRGRWAAEHLQLRTWLARRDHTPTLVVGDFNAVDDHGPMRQLYADGFASAADLAGAGFVRTYPSSGRMPPLIGIDHVLVDDRLTATSFETFAVPGTDHLGVRAMIAGTM